MHSCFTSFNACEQTRGVNICCFCVLFCSHTFVFSSYLLCHALFRLLCVVIADDADGSDDGSDVFPEVFYVIGSSDESRGGNQARNQSQMLKKREH